MGTRLFGAAALAIAVTAWGTPRSAFVVGSAAQDHAAEHPAQAQRPNMMDMQKTHAEMMADMKAGDAKLDALVKEMNAAAGDARADAVAAVVNELVRQHKAMHGRMGQMHEQMMGVARGGMMRK
jgi:hypothetical protein